MNKFKEFLQTNGITDDAFGKLEANKQAELHGEYLDMIAESLKGSAKASDLEAVKTALEDLKKAGATAEALKVLQTKMDGLATKLAEFEENGGNSEQKGVLAIAIEKTIKEQGLTNKDSMPARNYGEKITVKAAALMTTANVVPNVTGGFSSVFGNYIDTEIGHKPKDETVFLDLVTVVTQPGTENIYYTDRINEEGTAAFIAEGATKPLIDAEWKTTSLQTKEVANRWKMTTRLMYHAPAVVNDIKEHAEELVDQVVDTAILLGDGTGNNLNGIIAEAGAFVVPTGLAGYFPSANIWDVINAMATQIRIANFNGQLTVVLNTVYGALMAGIKDGEGRYMMPPFVSPDGRKVFDINVRFSNKIPATKILIGDLKKYKLVISEDAIYSEGFENDDFSKNLVSKKIESFMNGYLKGSYDGAILYDTIADVLTDIEEVVTP